MNIHLLQFTYENVWTSGVCASPKSQTEVMSHWLTTVQYANESVSGHPKGWRRVSNKLRSWTIPLMKLFAKTAHLLHHSQSLDCALLTTAEDVPDERSSEMNRRFKGSSEPCLLINSTATWMSMWKKMADSHKVRISWSHKRATNNSFTLIQRLLIVTDWEEGARMTGDQQH